MFRELNALAFRELIIESTVIVAYPTAPNTRKRSARSMRYARVLPAARANRE